MERVEQCPLCGQPAQPCAACDTAELTLTQEACASPELLPCAAQVVLFDVQQRTVLAELTVPYVKYVAWSTDMEHVAFLAKHAIVVANKKLANACTGVPLAALLISAKMLPAANAWSTDMEHVALLAKHAIVVANKKLANACTGKPWLLVRSLPRCFMLLVPRAWTWSMLPPWPSMPTRSWPLPAALVHLCFSRTASVCGLWPSVLYTWSSGVPALHWQQAYARW